MFMFWNVWKVVWFAVTWHDVSFFESYISQNKSNQVKTYLKELTGSLSFLVEVSIYLPVYHNTVVIYKHEYVL